MERDSLSSLRPSACVLPSMRPPAAILGGEAARAVMVAFARALHARGARVVGVVQETLLDDHGRKSDMVLVDVISGQRASVSQHLGPGSQSCSLDEQALCAISGQLQAEIAQKPALLVLSKFAHLEAEGRGFRSEFVAAVVAGVSCLTTVPPHSVAAWQAFTGEQGVLLPADLSALWQWWGEESRS